MKRTRFAQLAAAVEWSYHENGCLLVDLIKDIQGGLQMT